MKSVRLENDFHNTSTLVRLSDTHELSESQIARARRNLCGMEDCSCGGVLGERGPQSVAVYENHAGRIWLLEKY